MKSIKERHPTAAAILLFISFFLAFGLIEWQAAGRYGSLAAFFVLLGAFYYFKRTCMKKVPPPTPSMAIVMSMGVFVSDLFEELPLKGNTFMNFVQLSIICIFLLWLFLIVSYTWSIFTGEFYKRHMAGIFNSFGMGTWIAGASVCAMGIIMYLPEWIAVAYFIILVNSVLWLVFIGLCIRNIILLVKDKHLLLHGILLLSTVSTQSLAIDYSLVFTGHPPVQVFRALMVIGLCLYVACLALMVRSYLREKWTLDHQWLSTNCIIHGALSITGVAGIMTGVLNGISAWLLWGIVMVLFISVESVEVARAMIRYRRHGFMKGIGKYHYSHWARNFTFSMLLAFTIKLPKEGLSEGMLRLIQSFGLLLFSFVVFLLIYEGVLFFRDRGTWYHPKYVEK